MAMITRWAAMGVMLIALAVRSDETPASAPASQPSADAVELPEQLKTVTFNIQRCSGGIDRLIEFLRSQNADLIFLQEVPRPKTGEIDPARRIAEALNQMHFVSASTLKIPADQACDQAILSHFPLVDGEAHTLAKGGWVYAVQAAIGSGEHRVHLFSVHTHSTSRLEAEHIIQSSATRVEQVSNLLDVIRQLDGDVIVAGDFNAAPWMPEYYGLTRVLTDFGMVNQNANLSFPAHQPAARIDYFFGRGDLAARSYTVIDSRLSDHRPVVAELKRKEAASQPARDNRR